jgi:hypothetical protein
MFTAWIEESSMKHLNHSRQFRRTLLAGLLATSAAFSTGVLAGDSGVPSLQAYGKTVGEWSAHWWQWAQRVPIGVTGDQNPLTDTTGQYCGRGQSGPVWFLAGVWGSLAGTPVSRTCYVPLGKAMLFPIVNSLWVNTAWDDPNNTETQMRDCVAGKPGNVLGCTGAEQVAAGLVATLRKEPSGEEKPIVYGVPIVRTQSPVFTLSHYPVDSLWTVFGVPSWIFENGPSVSDGYWVLMPPLGRGTYVLKFSSAPAGQDVTYRLIVGP